MPVITIAQSKGGAGKTTLTLALASEYAAMGGSVIILDADRQKSMMNWQNDRVEAGRGTGGHASSRDDPPTPVQGEIVRGAVGVRVAVVADDPGDSLESAQRGRSRSSRSTRRRSAGSSMS